MRKNDLKVGETYAVHMSPTTARRKWGVNKPLKATLVAVQGEVAETLNVVGFSSYGKVKPFGEGWAEKAKTVSEQGIVVELAEPVRRGYVSPSGRYVESGGYGYRSRASYDPAERYEQDEFKGEPNMVTRIVLENGGCFVSTWADWEAEQAEQKAAKERRKDAAARALAQAQENAPKVQATLDRLTQLLGERGFSVERAKSYISDDYLPDAYEATRTSDENGFDRLTIDLVYHDTSGFVLPQRANSHPLADVRITNMPAWLLLDLLG